MAKVLYATFSIQVMPTAQVVRLLFLSQHTQQKRCNMLFSTVGWSAYAFIVDTVLLTHTKAERTLPFPNYITT